MRNLSKFYLTAGFLLMTLCGCQEDDLFGTGEKNSKVIDELVFSVNLSSNPATKSTYVGDMELVNEEGKKINVSMSMKDYIESDNGETSHTKGALINAKNFVDYVKEISVLGYLNGTDDAYVSVSNGPETITNIGTHDDNTEYPTHWAPSTTYYWPKGFNLDFWAWTMPAKESTTATSGVQLSNVVVTNQAASGATTNVTFHYDLGDGTDADDQPDLMFATTQNIRKGSGTVNDGCVPLDFKHALSAIQFKVVSTKGAKINEIKLVDVVKQGDGKFVLNETTPFTWSNNTVSDSNKGTYGHPFSTDLEENEEASDKFKYESDFYSSQPTANFMMIPQTLGTQSFYLSITTDENSAPSIYTGTIPVTEKVGAWAPGKTYVYTIYVDEVVNVTVSDEIAKVNNVNTKQNVVIKNTGSVKAYLRAAIIANWVDGNNRIIHKSWDGTGTWTATTLDGNSATVSDFYIPGGTSTDIGTGWKRGNDGYYYYINQVAPDQSPKGNLFDTYVPAALSGTDVAYGTAHLQFSVAVQAIQANMLIDQNGNFKTDSGAYGWNTGLLTQTVD